MTSTGVGTVHDPRTGRGTPLTPGVTAQFVRAEPDGRLRYSLPRVQVAVLNACAADAAGNIYQGDMAMLADAREVARAAKRHGGLVIVAVSRLLPHGGGGGPPLLLASEVDAIVVDPHLEQAATTRPPRSHYAATTQHYPSPGHRLAIAWP